MPCLRTSAGPLVALALSANRASIAAPIVHTDVTAPSGIHFVHDPDDATGGTGVGGRCKYKLRQDAELFDRAYGYFCEYY